MIFKNCATICNNTKVDNAKDLDIVMAVYNSIEYSDNYAERSGSLRQYCRDKAEGDITDNELLKFKLQVMQVL